MEHIKPTPRIVDFVDGFNIIQSERKYLTKYQCDKEVFFDTNELVDIIRGVWSYDLINQFNKQLFNSPSTLVNALLFDGILDKITLLPPHQEELRSKLIQNHLFAVHQVLSKSIDDFLSELGIGIVDLSDRPTKEEIKKYIDSITINAQALYKVNYLFKIVEWQKRLKFVLENVVNTNTELPDIEKILHNNMFILLKNELLQLRPKLIRNNIVDAISLTILHDKILKHTINPDKNPLPIFYTTSEVLFIAIQNVENIVGKPLYSFDFNNENISIIRKPISFIIDALLFIDENKVTNNSFSLFVNQIKILKQRITFKIDEYILTKRILGKDLKKQISDDIERIVEIDFFKNVWFEEVGKNEILDSILKYVNYKKSLSEEMLKWTIIERRLVNEKLGSSLTDFTKLQEEWIKKEEDDRHEIQIELLSNFEEIKNVLKANQKIPTQITYKLITDVIQEHALTRFSFTNSNCRDINNFYELLITYCDQESNEFDIRSNQLINNIIFGIYAHDKSDLLVGLAILWIFEKYELIIRLLNKLQGHYFSNYQLILLHAASLLRSGSKNFEEVQKLINLLIPISESNYKVKLGLSFLNFNFWRKLSDNPSIFDLECSNTLEKVLHRPEYVYSIECRNQLISVIKYLNEIKNSDIEKRKYRNAKYYYSINNLIYYTTLSAPKEEFNTIDDYVNQLRQVELEDQIWLLRYNDTLSNYYLRKCIYSTSEAEFNSLLEQAKKRHDKLIGYEMSKVNKIYYEQFLTDYERVKTYGFKNYR